MTQPEIDFTPQDASVLRDVLRFAESIARAKRTPPADRLSASKVALLFSKQLNELEPDRAGQPSEGSAR